MKKTLSLLFIVLAVFSAKAQKSVLFKMKYLPNRNYVSSMVMNTDMKMDFKGDSAEIAKIGAQGAKLPIIMTSTVDMGFTFKTGAEDNLKNFPFYLSYDKITTKQIVGGNEFPVPASPMLGQKLYGKFSADGKMSLDSASGNKIEENMKKPLLDMIVKMQNAIQFPEKPLKVGESFTQDIPMNMPVAGENMSVNVKTIYKLISINQGIAYFDVIQGMDMNMTIKEKMMIMKGDGSGKLEYLIKDNFIKKMDSNLTMSYDMQMEKVKMEGLAKIKSAYSVVIN